MRGPDPTHCDEEISLCLPTELPKDETGLWEQGVHCDPNTPRGSRLPVAASQTGQGPADST